MSDFQLHPQAPGLEPKLQFGTDNSPVVFPFVAPTLQKIEKLHPNLQVADPAFAGSQVPTLVRVFSPTPKQSQLALPLPSATTPTQEYKPLPGMPIVTPTVSDSESETTVNSGATSSPLGFDEYVKPKQKINLFQWVFPRVNAIQIGDIVKRKDNVSMRTAFTSHPFVVVVGLSPLVLVSDDGKDRWSTQLKLEDFIHVGVADNRVMGLALARIRS
jgi:hypothetical protein